MHARVSSAGRSPSHTDIGPWPGPGGPDLLAGPRVEARVGPQSESWTTPAMASSSTTPAG